MAASAIGTVPRNSMIVLDPLGVENLNPPPPQIQASLLARVWTAGKYGTIGGVAGAMVGFVGGKFLSKSSKDDQSSSLQGMGTLRSCFSQSLGLCLGGAIGFVAGTCYSLYRDHYLHFHLSTDFVGKDGNTTRQMALQKANTIFRTYANKRFGNDEGLCDDILTFNLFIYPVKAGDGKIYEHSAIHRYLTVNYPVAVQAYEKRRREFPNDPTVLPPSSSPVGYGDVTLNNLKLDSKRMGIISKKMAGFFKDLRRWESQIQPPLDEAYQKESFSIVSVPQTVLSEEAVRAVNEKVLAQKVCTQTPLSLEEIFTIKQLFDYYLVELKERDSRIYEAISAALVAQRGQNILDQNRFIEEMQELSKWYASAKELYK